MMIKGGFKGEIVISHGLKAPGMKSVTKDGFRGRMVILHGVNVPGAKSMTTGGTG